MAGRVGLAERPEWNTGIVRIGVSGRVLHFDLRGIFVRLRLSEDMPGLIHLILSRLNQALLAVTRKTG